MINIKQKITLIGFLFFCVMIYGQTSDLGFRTENHSIHSQDKNEYILKITFPRNYNPDKAYKTLYYLDAYWLKDITIGSYTVLNLCDYVENIVLVGISVKGTEEDWHKQRDMDFTPSQFQNLKLLDSLKKSYLDNNIKVTVKTSGGNLLHTETTGGADLFLDFLENDVFKFIEKNIQT